MYTPRDLLDEYEQERKQNELKKQNADALFLATVLAAFLIGVYVGWCLWVRP